MRKKFFSIVMCLCMVSMLFAGCKKQEEQPKTDDTNVTNVTTEAPKATEAPVTTQAPVAVTSELPKPVYYYSFDEADGTDGIQVAIKDTAATPIVQPFEGKDVIFVDGVKGQAIYADGVTAYKLPDVNGVGDNYTISYWVNPSRCATYMPTVQFGPDIHGDLTGGQHYVNFTWAEWSGESAFPCVWAYDQLDNAKWPNYSPEAGEGTHVKEWLNITLVVDASNLTDDGTLINSKLYVNNVLYSDQVKLVFNTMQPSDNFEMLLGLNYWDTTFKGAFDELYIFDTPLDENQVAELYKAGNQKATYVEPEHVFEFYQEEGAIDSIGNTDLSTSYWTDFSQAWKISDGQTLQFKFHNWSNAEETFNNYSMVFANSDVPEGVIPSAGTIDGYEEYVVVRADASGYTPEGELEAKLFNYTWGNWKTWSNKVMRDADVTVTVTRDGANLSIQADNVDYNESANTMYATLENIVTGDNCYIFFTCEGSYVDILSAKDKTVSANAGITVGAPDCSSGFWSEFSPIWQVPDGESRTFSFTNYTNGENAWNNFVMILQSTPTGHNDHGPVPEGYKEYAVLRADNWGWGDNFGNTDADKYSEWNWENFSSILDGAHVDATVTNKDGIVNVYFDVTSSTGVKYPQYYYNIAVDGDVYASFTVDGSFLQFDSTVIGATDLSSNFWTEFSDIWSVPAGTTKSVSFRNYTDGANAWDNFALILQNVPFGHNNFEIPEGYREYAVLRADNWGWGDNFANTDDDKNCTWNWDTFTSDIDGAYVDLHIVNDGSQAKVNIHVTTVDGKEYIQNYQNIAVDGDLYACFTLEHAYLVIDACQVGTSDNGMNFWTQFSPIVKVADGETKSLSLTNWTDGANAWDNFAVILQSTPTGHNGFGVLPEGYKEYAVLRADNWGWGDNFGNTDDDKNCTWNWDTFTSDIDGAKVLMNISNNAGVASVDIYATTAAGKIFEQHYTNIAVDGDLYYTITGEKCHFTID